ncbi:excinuclease ABC subunit UvrC [Magnetococcales bacterium HHB-1]
MNTPHPLKAHASTLPLKPGVYRFLDQNDTVLYVGKAKALRKRVASYFTGTPIAKITTMLGQAERLKYTLTLTENEALLLEADLIKKHQPRFNVLLKDGKSYPYLHLSSDHDYPRLSFYRGKRHEQGHYFGPFPSVLAVRETLKTLQRLFPLRQCSDSQFSSRIRPCLQYQIKRCSAPCCNKIDQPHYQRHIHEMVQFLEGKDQQLLDQLEKTMWQAAKEKNYEEAAILRDRIKAIRYVQEKKKLGPTLPGDVDIIGLVREQGRCKACVLFIRNGINWGDRELTPQNTQDDTIESIMSAFLQQFYANKTPPKEILISHTADNQAWLEAAFSEKREKKVRIHAPKRGTKYRLIETALTNAKDRLHHDLNSRANQQKLLQELGETLGMTDSPERIEVYDVSHIQDSHPVGSMIVFGVEGFIKNHYRRFSLNHPALLDDTARMAEMLRRRFHRLKTDEAEGFKQWPDLILLDGGQGQLNAVLRVADEMQIDGITFCGIAKGPDRNAGRERLFLPNQETPLILPKNASVLFLLQNIRDEAHRFAIGYHRLKRKRAQRSSILDHIPGVGTKRKKQLLKHFGSVKAMRAASLEMLQQTPGIPKPLGERIFNFLQNEN